MEIEVIYESEDIVALNKPAGLLVHGTARGEGDTLADWLLINCPEVAGVGDKPSERPGIVHRLDKDTSGVILVARNQETFTYLKGLFQKGEIKKTYRAIVYGAPGKREGLIDKPISLKSGSVKRTVHDGKMTKDAVTGYKLLKDLGGYGYVEVSPQTGRTHQIRVHLASIGHPVVGDKLYGGKKGVEGVDRHMLHAYSLQLELGSGTKVELVAELPDDFKEALKSLEK